MYMRYLLRFMTFKQAFINDYGVNTKQRNQPTSFLGLKLKLLNNENSRGGGGFKGTLGQLPQRLFVVDEEED